MKGNREREREDSEWISLKFQQTFFLLIILYNNIILIGMVLYTNAFYCVVHILIPFNFVITGKKKKWYRQHGGERTLLYRGVTSKLNTLSMIFTVSLDPRIINVL